MNIIKEKRIEKGLSVEEIAVILKIKDAVYLKHEVKCDFTESQYRRICKVLAIDYDTPLFI